MMDEFVDEFNGLKVNDKIKIIDECLPFGGGIPVPNSYLDYINLRGNCFTIKDLFVIDGDDVMIGVYEVKDAVGFYQVESCDYFNPRVLNFGKRVNNGKII